MKVVIVTSSISGLFFNRDIRWFSIGFNNTSQGELNLYTHSESIHGNSV